MDLTTPAPRLGPALLCLALGVAWLGLKCISVPTDPTLTFYLDEARGLRHGDAVYLEEQQVGRVLHLQRRGRRIAITVQLDCRQGCRIREDDQLYLWHDIRHAERQSLRVLPSSASVHRQPERAGPEP